MKKKALNESIIERELEKRQRARVIRSTLFDITQFLFTEQLAFVQDPSPFKVAVCSRRSGKTVACAAHLIDTALQNDNVTCLYVTLSRNNAKKIIWRELLNINIAFQLGGKTDLTELSITFPNGSVIYLSGAKDASEIEKFRGLAVKLVYIDEAQSFRDYIQDLVDDVIAPALMDYAGTLCLIGTPGPIPAGYFYDCAEKFQTWSKHAWTFFQNPFITIKSKMTHQQMLERELKRRGVVASDPSIQREWFGKWVLDSDSLLIHYNPTLNDMTGALPQASYTYILGIDLGFNDADALALLAWSETDKTTYLIEESVTPKQGMTELVEQIRSFQKRFPSLSKLVIDEGGLGKKLAEEMRRRHQLPLQAADKKRKMENVAILNDALRTGAFKAYRGSRFAQDSYLVEIDRDKSTPDKIRVSDRYHSDVIDAVLYAYKESPAYAYQKPEAKPAPGSQAYYDAEAKRLEEAAEEFFKAQEDALKNDPYNN